MPRVAYREWCQIRLATSQGPTTRGLVLQIAWFPSGIPHFWVALLGSAEIKFVRDRPPRARAAVRCHAFVEKACRTHQCVVP